MANDPPRYNIVTFTKNDNPSPPTGDGGGEGGDEGTPPPDDPGQAAAPVALTLEGPITLTAGLKPNVWGARCSYKEFAKLGDDMSGTGRIELWYKTQPGNGQSDVLIDGVSIVGVEAAEFGEVTGKGDPIIVEYRLSFADSREQYVEPKGGRLRVGLVNPSRKLKVGDITSPTATSEDDADTGAVTLTLGDMIRACLLAMGVSDLELPSDADDFEAPKDVKWFGNHAPTELAKLLPLCNAVIAPDLNGELHVYKIGDGDDPDYGDDDNLDELQVPAVDRRGAAVIFSSYPTRITQTEDIQGPAVGKWEFVVQDHDDLWKSIRVADICEPTGRKLIGIVQAQFDGVSDVYRSRLEAQAYRYIRLSASYLPPALSPVLRGAFDGDGNPEEMYVEGDVAVVDPTSGIWDNGTDVVIGARFINEGNIIQLDKPALAVDASTNDPYAHAQELGATGLTVHLSYEDSEVNDDGDWEPKFFHVGYTLPAGGSVTKMSDDDVENAITGGMRGAFVITRPDFRLYYYNGSPVNKTDLENKAKKLAAQYLADSSNPVRILSGRGFHNAAPTGVVSEVRWDQERLQTDAYCGNWFAPDGALSDLGIIRKLEAQEAYPNQHKTEAGRSALGESGANHPVAPVQPFNRIPKEVPPGIGRYKVLMQLDDTGGYGWDFERFD